MMRDVCELEIIRQTSQLISVDVDQITGETVLNIGYVQTADREQ